jgi:hypothetical protein
MDASAKLKKAIYQREWNKNNKEKRCAYSRDWAKNNKERYKLFRDNWNKKNPHRITEYRKRSAVIKLQKLEKQAKRPISEKCDACGSEAQGYKNRMCYDHDHLTNKFRGWICERCNLILGHAKDSPSVLLALANYLNNQQEASA